MKKLQFTFNLFLLIFFFSSTAYAHTIGNNGSISALLHLSPYDLAIAGGKSELTFEIIDKTGKFNPSYCNCEAQIKKDEKVLYSTPIFSNHKSSFRYVFPEVGNYEASIIGEAKNGSFTKFDVDFPIKVYDRKTALFLLPIKYLSYVFGHSFLYLIIGTLLIIACVVVGVLRLLGKVKG